MAQVGGPNVEDERDDGRDGREASPAWRCTDVALDGAAVVERAALRDRLLDELVDEARRMRRRSAVGRGLDRADDRGLERRIALLEIHRHLRVGHAPPQRPHQAVEEQADEHGDHDDAERDDRWRAEAEATRGPRPRGAAPACVPANDDHGAPQGEPQAPAIAHSDG